MATTEKRGSWGSSFTFILASIGSAVGLGNAWRFPGLAAKHGGGAFMLAYLIIMVTFGIPLLMMEIAIGRKMRRGAPEAMRGMNKKLEPIGWAATANAFVIAVYYAVVFAWVILMAILSFKYINIPGDTAAAESLWATAIQTTGNFTGFGKIVPLVLLCLAVAWFFIWYCIRHGANSVSRVVKYTVSLPVVCLLIMAVKGLTMPGAADGIRELFVPDFSKWATAELWADAAGQVFYSLSIMMAIMFAYGSFVKKDAKIAWDATIIAVADFLTSLLSSIVLFTTMYGVGMNSGDMLTAKGSVSGISTAFVIYPTAITQLTDNGVANAVFAFIFYFCLCTLAIDSAFSIIEGVSTALSDKFHLKKDKTTLIVCLVAGVLSLTMATRAGLAILDVVDNWCNVYNLVIVGIFESVAVGWFFRTEKVLDEVNKNIDGKLKMPGWWFKTSVKFIAPLVLSAILVWNFVALVKGGFVYGKDDGYTLLSNIVCGWLITALVLASGFIVNGIVKHRRKKGYVEDEVSWDTADEADEEA